MTEAQYESKNFATVNLDALIHNYRRLTEKAREKTPNALPICVVKADAYGHGAVPCVKALLEAGADFFAVSDISEALEIRRITRDARVLILGYTLPQNACVLVENDIIQAVYDIDYAKRLSSFLEEGFKSGRLKENDKLSLHIKLNTGMNRLGFSLDSEDFSDSVEQIAKIPEMFGLLPVAVFSHFACADEPDSEMTEAQIKKFDCALRAIKEKGLDLKAHISNSAGTIRFGGAGYDYIRLGISLYGCPPSSEVKQEGLRSVMQLYSSISQIHILKKGESVSYGATFTADKDMRVASVSMGYADGLVRACSGGDLLVGGRKARIIGRICMDQCVIELGDIEAKEGDLVTVYDESGENIEALAKRAGTINYELLCLVGKRVLRKYKRDND